MASSLVRRSVGPGNGTGCTAGAGIARRYNRAIQDRYPATFGQWLRARRRALDLTQRELAERTSCAVITVRKIESDERRPSPTLAGLLADELGVTGPDRERFLASARAELAADRLAGPDRAPSWPAGVPAPLAGLVGRQAEVRQLIELLAVRGGPARLVTIVGPPGVGKTRLAVEVAGALIDTAGTTVHFVALSAVTDPELVLPTVATAVKPGGEFAGRGPAEVLAEALAGAASVLVLDNLEQVLDAAPALGGLLERIPGLCLLTTSRERLGLYGEHEFTLEPLPPAAAYELFVQRVRSVDRAFRPDDVAADIARICQRLDGLPLAVELAAGLVRARSVAELDAELAAGLDAVLPELATATRGSSSRHRTMINAVDWSYRLLRAEQRAAFRALSVFRGGWTREAVQVVLGDAGVPGPDHALNALLDHSLVRRVGGGSAPRFTMFEVLREFAARRLDEAGETTAAGAAHAGHYRTVAERAADRLVGGADHTALARLAEEHDNLRAALGWAIERGDGVLAQRLVGALGMFWHLRGHWSEGRRWAEAALRLSSSGPPAPRALALRTAGLLAWAQDDRASALELLDAAVAAAGAAVDPLTLADTTGIRGLVGLSAGEPDVERYLERSVACYRQAGSEGGVAVSMLRLGLAALTRGELDRAAALIDDAIARYRALGSVWGTATAMCNRADVHRAGGDWEPAAAGYADGFRRYLTISAGWYSAGAAAGLATALTGLERHSAAAAMYGAVEAALERLRMPMHPLDLPPFETGRAATRRALGDRYGRLAAAGRSWSEAELLAAVDAVVAPQ